MQKYRIARPVSVKPRPKPKKDQTDLNGLVKNINTLLADKRYYPLDVINAKELVDTCKEILMPLKINLTYENLSCLERTDKIRSMVSAPPESVSFVGITDPEQIVKRFRILLSTIRHKADFDIPIVRQCNGVVMEIVELDNCVRCNVLVVPPHDFNPNFHKSSVLTGLSKNQYVVHEICDGTTITLYYDPNYLKSDDITTQEGDVWKTQTVYSLGRWVKSTKNAYDMDDVFWRGYSYKYIVDDVLSAYGDMNLKTHRTYTLGFKHPAYHPFQQPKEWRPETDKNTDLKWIKHAWIIQIYDRTTQDVIPEDPDVNIPAQSCVTDVNLAKLDNSLQDYLDHNQVFLGYIFRSKTSGSDVIMESSLWHTIRHAVYQLPFVQNKVVRDRQEQNFKSMQYVVIDAFLDMKKQQMFLRLFPQYQEKFQEFERILDAVVNKIYEDLNKKDFLFHIELPQKDREQKIIAILATKFTSIVGSQYQPVSFQVVKDGNCVSEAVDKKMIKTLISHTKYADVYANVFAM